MKLYFILALLLFVPALAQEDSVQEYCRAVPERFQTVPDDAKPWCYYWILKGNINERQITHDLEAMAEKGFGGVLVFDSRFYHDDFDSKDHVPVPLEIQNEFMSESWQALILHLIREADRVGMKVSLNIADSGGVLRGPWEMGANGPKEVLWTEQNVNGPRRVTLNLATPDEYRHYTDFALIAVRVTSAVASGRESVRLGDTWYPVREFTGTTVADVTDLKSFVNSEGSLTWDVPEGSWKILRFGSHVVGDFGAVDILSESAITSYFHKFADPLIEKAGPLVGKTLTHFYNVSWEGSNPNWTPEFPETFRNLNGYEVTRFLPVLCGFELENRTNSERFLTDYYRTVSALFRENCYANIGRMCHAAGIVWHSEDGGPWRRTAPIFRESDMLTFWGQNDVAQGEFWVYEDDHPKITRSNMRYTAMAAHIHGQRNVAVEAFTHMNRHWTSYPAHLKLAADSNLIDGANMFIWHTFTASLPEFGMPGFEYFAGTHINTNVTWFPYIEGIVTYLGRCQYMLRQGTFVADACVYVSDRNYMDWKKDEKWNSKSTLTLPPGYTYDLLDTDSLTRLEYQDGFLTLPCGMRYRILVVDPVEAQLPLASLEKLESLQRAGAPLVFGKMKPESVRGLKNQSEADTRLAEIVQRIWKPCENLESTLDSLGIQPDFEGPFAYHHRMNAGQEIYFISGEGEAECTFRVTGKTPRLWNPITGKVQNVPFTTEAGRTRVAIALPKSGSVFVVFEEDLSEPKDFDSVQVVNSTALPGPWHVQFDSRYAQPAELDMTELEDWTHNANDTIRYYSGTATYSLKFTQPEKLVGTRHVLNLGRVGHVARVRLNGQDLGVVWCEPWTVDVTAALRSGENTLEIDVANVWANRLAGDALLPPEKRYTRTNMHFYDKPGDVPEGGARKYMPWQGFHKHERLLSSGLLGPVVLKSF